MAAADVLVALHEAPTAECIDLQSSVHIVNALTAFRINAVVQHKNIQLCQVSIKGSFFATLPRDPTMGPFVVLYFGWCAVGEAHHFSSTDTKAARQGAAEGAASSGNADAAVLITR